MPFIPPGFEKLVEHGYGPQAETRREHVDDLRDAIRGHRRIILLGDPGSGKTTTLWRLAYDYATTAREDAQAPLPVLVPLGGCTDNGPFDACLAHHLGSLAPYLETYRSSGRLILLLDGLNEMPQADYTERVGHIQDVLNRYPDGTTVITCRALDYVVELKQLQKVEVSPLDETRMRDFLHNYLGETAGERLLQAMEQTGLRALGHNPYLLLMTAQVYAGAEGKLPANRAKLFSAFVDTLLRREEKRHPESWIEIEDDFFVAFQYALDDLVREDKRLVKLLDWAARKSAAVTTPLRHAALRSTCCQIALAIARGRTLVESGDIDYSYLFDRTRDQARALAHSLGYDQDCDRVPSLDLDFAVSYALTRALTCARPIVRGGRGTFVAAFSKAKAVSRENKAHDLYHKSFPIRGIGE